MDQELKSYLDALQQRIFDRIDERFTTLNDRISTLDSRISTLEGRFTNLDDRISKLDERISTLDERISTLDERISMLDERISTLEQSILERTQEMVRDAQTEILRAFERYQNGVQIRLRSLEAETSNLKTAQEMRLANHEERIAALEAAILRRHPAA